MAHAFTGRHFDYKLGAKRNCFYFMVASVLRYVQTVPDAYLISQLGKSVGIWDLPFGLNVEFANNMFQAHRGWGCSYFSVGVIHIFQWGLVYL